MSLKINNQCSHFFSMASVDNIKNTRQLQENTVGGKYDRAVGSVYTVEIAPSKRSFSVSLIF